MRMVGRGGMRRPSLAAHSSGKIMSVGGLPAFCAMCNRSQERVFEEIFDSVNTTIVTCSDLLY